MADLFQENILIYHLANFHRAIDRFLPANSPPAKKKSKATDELFKFKCNLCGETAASQNGLTTHLATSHFYDRLVKLYCRDGSSSCLACDKTFDDNSGLVIHLALDHAALEELVTAKPARGTDDKAFECHLCGSNETGFDNLLLHYLSDHFERDVADIFANADNRCTFCSEGFLSESEMLRHLVLKHEALRGFIPDMSSLEVRDHLEL